MGVSRSQGGAEKVPERVVDEEQGRQEEEVSADVGGDEVQRAEKEG